MLKASDIDNAPRLHFSWVLCTKVNGQNDISAGDFDIFRPKFTYFKNCNGHIDKILPIVM